MPETWCPGAPATGQPDGLSSRRAGAVERLLRHYDRLVLQARGQQERRVLTHGEPHPGNLIETSAGWLLIDWDTAS